MSELRITPVQVPVSQARGVDEMGFAGQPSYPGQPDFGARFGTAQLLGTCERWRACGCLPDRYAVFCGAHGPGLVGVSLFARCCDCRLRAVDYRDFYSCAFGANSRCFCDADRCYFYAANSHRAWDGV